MAIIKSFAPFLNLSNFQVFENDDLPQSEYFRITELNETLTGGKNGFLIEGSEHLKESTEVKIEILDVEGNPIYFEPGDGTPEYYEGNSKLIAVHVYDDTPIGIGKITILGELKTYLGENDAVTDIPSEWQGVYNVKWERSIQVNKNLSNETIVRFYKRPVVTIDEIVKPIITKTIPQVTQTGSLAGIPLNPPFGTDLTKWRAGIQYRLRIDDGPTWSASVDENIVSVPSLGYSAKIREILSKTDVVVDTPYTASDNTVTTLPSSDYSVTFDNKEASVIGESTLTGSFAKMNFSNLKTFVGDVARVKVFRKSRNAVGDFQFVQESKLESSELLRDITTSQDTELSYGLFDAYNLETYWVTSSEDHPVSIDNDVLMASVKTDYNESSGGTQTISTSGSFSISKDVEYTLNFRTLLSGALDDSGKSVRAYFSGSNYEQNFLTASGSAIYRARQNLTQNILATSTVDDVHLKFDISGSDWYISNVSLKNAQDTSFSPDEFTLIQDIPRKLAVESFDFKFEFYDINNNYIPVDVFATKEFDGGNDFPTSGQLLTFESDRNAFRFISGSVQNPENQTIKFSLTRANLTGSVTFASSAFDIAGNFLDPADYSVYPGALTSVSPAGALITIDNFTGSRIDGSESPYVGSVVYTASLEDLEEFETIYRLEDGENAPQLIVTSNANQFIYEPTTLSAKPQGQSITINAKRKNLASFTTPITVNSGSGAPGISGSTDNTTGVDTYTIHSDYYSASFAGSTLEEVTYSFTGSDQFGIAYSDEVTISPVINFDGVSLVLSNESTAFPAKSTGEVEGGFASSKGNVQMFIGGNQITHDDIGGGRAKNTFDITSISGDNVTPEETSPTTNEYGISAFDNSASSGSLTLNIEYLAGDNSTSQSFQKVVSYSKSKKAVPNVEVFAQPAAQTINANSVGSGSSTPENIVVKAKEGNTDRFTSIGAVTGSNGLTTSVSSEVITITSTASDMTSDTGVLQIPINFTDGEGTTGSKLVEVTVSRVRIGTPSVQVSVQPSAQTIDGNSQGSGSVSPLPILVSAGEGGTSRFTGFGTIEFSGGLSATANAFNELSPADVDYTWSQNTTDSDPGSGGIKSVAGNGASSTQASQTANFRRVNIGSGNLNTLLTSITGSVGSDGYTYVLRIEHSAGGGRFKEYEIEGVSLGGGIWYRVDLAANSHSGSIASYGSFINSSTVPVTIKRRASNVLVFTDTASDMTSDTETITIPVNFTDSEGTTGTKTVEASITRTRTAQPSTNFNVTPAAQTIAANSTGTLTGTIQDITIDGFDGNTALTYNQGTLSSGEYKITNISGVTVSDTTPSSKTFSITSFSGDTASGSADISFVDTEGTSGTSSVDFTLSKSKAATPVVTISANPQAQSVASNADFSSVGTPSTVTISVNEGGSNYTYQSGTGDIDSNKFRITGVTNGTNNNNGTITPTTPTGGSGTTSVVTLSYTNSEGTEFTSKTITINVGVAAQGSDGATGAPGADGVSGLSFDISPAGQSITRTQTPVTYGTPSAFTVNVFQGATQFTYDNSSPYSSGSFYIDNVSGGTNNNDKTITPTTPSSLTAVTTTFDINYTDVSGSTGTVSKSHITNVVIDGNTGPGIVHTGEWESGRNYQFSDDGGGTGRRDSVLYNNVYYAATAQHTSTDNTNSSTGRPGSGPWQSLGSQDLFVAAKIAIFEESFVKNTLNVGTNAPQTGDDVSSANITIAGSGANPYLSIGQSGTISNQGFDNPGVFIGNDGGTAKLSLKKQSGTNYLKWDGDNLEIAGSITITAGNAATTTDVNNSVLSGSAAATAAQNAGETAAANAAASASVVQGNVDGLNIPTVPTTFNPNNLTNVGTPSVSGLHLGEDKMGFYNASSPAGWKAYLDNSGNFFLGSGTSFPLSFTASSGVLNVNRITATTGTVGAFTIDSNSIHSGTKGSNAAFTSAGSITFSSTGYISAPAFYIDTSGNFVQDNSSTKIKSGNNIRPFDDVFDISSTSLGIKRAAKVFDGSNVASFEDAFKFEGGSLKLNNTLPVFGSTTGISSRFSTVEQDILTVASFSEENCVLPGTKIVTNRGEINVEDTTQHDLIKVFDFETNEWRWSSIDEIIVGKSKGWCILKTESGNEIRCSKSHALYHPDFKEQTLPVSYLSKGDEIYIVNDGTLVLDKVKSIERFEEEVQVWNYHLSIVHNYISNGFLSHNLQLSKQAFTAGHQYVKLNSESIGVGDLVKIDSDNQIIKSTTAKDTEIVGILWKEARSGSVYDSFGDELPENEMSSKTLWRVASIGDSIISGSNSLLPGFKVCNQGGDVSKGDLLCSSDTAGYLMKQPSEYVITSFDSGSNPIYEERQSQCSYTVAKCMEDVTFDSNGLAEQVYGYLYCG